MLTAGAGHHAAGKSRDWRLAILAAITRNTQLAVPVFAVAISGTVGVDRTFVVIATGEKGDLSQAGEEILIAGGALDFAVFQHRAAAFLVTAHRGNGRRGVADTGGGCAAGGAATNGVVFHLRAIFVVDTQATYRQSAGGDFRCGVGDALGAAMHGAVAAHQTESALVAVFTIGDGHSVIDQRAAVAEPDERYGQIVVETAGGAVAGDHTRIALRAGAHADPRIRRAQAAGDWATANHVAGAAGGT